MDGCVITQKPQFVKEKVILVLSDQKISEGRLPINAFMATGSRASQINPERTLRCDSNILVETGFARDPIISLSSSDLGATAVYPYLAYQVLNDLIRTNELLMDPIEAKQLSKGY